MNFSGSAGDMLAAMQAAGIVVPEATEAAQQVAKAEASAPAEGSCGDPSCTVDHSHGGHDHKGHSHEHGHGHDHKEEGCTHESHDHKGHDHEHAHGHGHSHKHAAAALPVLINCQFDSGNIEVEDASDPSGKGVQLRVRKDVPTELEKRAHMQWFHFKVTGVSDGTAAPATKFSIVNAGQCSFPEAWPGTTVCASFDRQEWFRCVDTTYDKASGHLDWTFDAATHPGAAGKSSTVVWFAYFPPYSWERHQDLLGSLSLSPLVQTSVIGQTLEGRDLDLYKIGGGATKVWVIARQHPGEPQAEWFTEGFLKRLTDRNDALARQVRSLCTVYVIPNMNPDGSVKGHLRTNAAGANLNREWNTTGAYEAPTLKRSPEVYYCQQEMAKTGVDMFLDVHGDEEIPMNFVSGMEGVEHWGPRLEALQGLFVNKYCRVNPDMQGAISYEPMPAGGANLAICSDSVAQKYNCLALTFEQPFKDCATMPDPNYGWTGPRCSYLGASLIDVIVHCQPYLRVEGPFWEKLDPKDTYVRPTEGNSQSVFRHFAAGNEYDNNTEATSSTELDTQLRDAQAKVADLLAQRAHLSAAKD